MFWQSRQFKRYLDENWQRLYRLAYAWCHDPQLASDIVQETLSRTFKQHYQFENDKAINVWMYKVMSRVWFDHYRKQRDFVDIDDEPLQSESNTEEEQSRHEVLSHIQHAMSQLKVDHRQIVTLIDIEECSYSEVAEILSIPVGTVMSRLNRARHQLRELLQEHAPFKQHKHARLRRVK